MTGRRCVERGPTRVRCEPVSSATLTSRLHAQPFSVCSATLSHCCPLPTSPPFFSPHTPPHSTSLSTQKHQQTLLDESDKERAADLAELLYETSLLTSGFALEQPKDYASKVYTLMQIALGVDVGAEEEEQPPAAAAAAAASEPAAAAASESSSESESSKAPKVEAVEADVVVEGKGGDPWGKN